MQRQENLEAVESRESRLSKALEARKGTAAEQQIHETTLPLAEPEKWEQARQAAMKDPAQKEVFVHAERWAKLIQHGINALGRGVEVRFGPRQFSDLAVRVSKDAFLIPPKSHEQLGKIVDLVALTQFGKEHDVKEGYKKGLFYVSPELAVWEKTTRDPTKPHARRPSGLTL